MANPLPGIVSPSKGPPPKMQPNRGPPAAASARRSSTPVSAARDSGTQPDAVVGNKRPGATDGLGRGRGGLACSGEMAQHGIDQYEGRHTSKTR